MYHRIVEAIGLAFLTSLVSIHASGHEMDLSTIEQVIQKEMETKQIPGAAVAIIQDGKLLFCKGFGVSNFETKEPASESTLFRVGSVTKMFTAAAVVSLAHEGKIDLDASVSDYVPDLPPALAKVTIHQLLSHTAGLKDKEDRTTIEHSLKENILSWGENVVQSPPDEIFSYSNIGYNLLGVLLETVEAKPYADVVLERVLHPLGMERSTFHVRMAMTYPAAMGHQSSPTQNLEVVRPYPDSPANWPAGFLISSASELARFALAMVNQGKIEDQQVIAPEVIQTLFTKHADIPGTRNESYGYGFMRRDNRGIHIVEHGGMVDGFLGIVHN